MKNLKIRKTHQQTVKNNEKFLKMWKKSKPSETTKNRLKCQKTIKTSEKPSTNRQKQRKTSKIVNKKTKKLKKPHKTSKNVEKHIKNL